MQEKEIVEKRRGKVMFVKSGSGSANAKINLSVVLLKEMGIDANDRDVDIIYTSDNEIIIRKSK